jgi:hypothetical protein
VSDSEGPLQPCLARSYRSRKMLSELIQRGDHHRGVIFPSASTARLVGRETAITGRQIVMTTFRDRPPHRSPPLTRLAIQLNLAREEATPSPIDEPISDPARTSPG